MPRKARDHAAEYARKKARAAQYGLTVREARNTSKVAKSVGASNLNQLANDNLIWSVGHSQRRSSKSPDKNDPNYWKRQTLYAKVFRSKERDPNWKRDLYTLLVTYGDMSHDEFIARYGPL